MRVAGAWVKEDEGLIHNVWVGFLRGLGLILAMLVVSLVIGGGFLCMALLAGMSIVGGG